MLKKSLKLTKQIFKPYTKFTKAGVILHKLQSNQYIQKQLFNEQITQKEFCQDRLDYIIDEINNRSCKHTINWGSSMIEKEWDSRREKLSSVKTTDIENIPIIYAN